MAKKFKANFSDIPQQTELSDLLTSMQLLVSDSDKLKRVDNIKQLVDKSELMDAVNKQFTREYIVNETNQIIDEVASDNYTDLDLKIKAKTLANSINSKPTKQQIIDVAQSDINQEIDKISDGDVDVKNDIVEAFDNIDDFDATDLPDIQVKNKQIFLRNIVGNSIMSMLVNKINVISKGNIISRKTSLTTITNINKRIDSFTDLKLSKDCYTIKPKDSNKIKKGTRIIISIDDEYRVNNNVVIYIQNGVEKFIKKIEFKQQNIKWMIDFIAYFYNNTFEYSKAKLLLYGNTNELSISRPIQLMQNVVKTNNYLISPLYDYNSEIYGFKTKTKSATNKWLIVYVTLDEITDKFTINAKNELDDNWIYNHKNGDNFTYSFDELYDNLINVLDELYSKELWNVGKVPVDISDLSKLTYPIIKRVYKKLSSSLDIKILKVLSQSEVLDILTQNGKNNLKSYGAETIIFNTPNHKYVALSQVNNITNKDPNIKSKYIKFQIEYMFNNDTQKHNLSGVDYKQMFSEIGVNL